VSLSLLAAAAEQPERVALIAGGVAHTFADLAPRVRRIGGWLAAQGIDRRQAPTVALVADNRVDTLLALYALWELGAPVAVVHPRLTARERELLLAAAAPALVLDESWREGEAAGCPAPPPAPPPPDDERCLAVVFTSGTTGRSKGALLGRAALVAAARASAANLGWQEEDRWLLCMPLAHVGGLSIVSRCLLARRTVVLAEPAAGGRFDPSAVVEETERHRATLASLVPTMLRGIFAARPDWTPPPWLRGILLGGAAASPALLDEAAGRGVPALTTYGLTEACAQVTCQRYGTRPGAQHGAGAPLSGVELRIVEDEIQVRGPMLMSGYLGLDAQPFVDGGWLATGDFGAIDDEGRLHLLARRSDLIVTGGENVYPVEIELLVEGLPGVAGACVFGVADETWGQRVALALVPSSGGPPVDDELAAFFRANLAPHKRPRAIAELESLPATQAGKLDRAEVARQATPRLRPLRG
jgi:O-succinylbenzoic acid--CoA ligase